MSYNKKFYEEMKMGECSNLTSARVIVPYILELFPRTKSVVDFGCGIGAWLSVFTESGVEDIVGIDGDWVDQEELMIKKEKFCSGNLEKGVDLHRRFDLAISVEVAEHLAIESADIFVESITKCADVVIFSAAIPNQGGQHHVNEQWQSYWYKKFSKRGYIAIDPIRGFVSGNPKVMLFYAQNILVYIKKDRISKYPEINRFIGIPFTIDYALPFLALQYLAKDNCHRSSWKSIFRLQIICGREIIKKVFHLKEYKE